MQNHFSSHLSICYFISCFIRIKACTRSQTPMLAPEKAAVWSPTTKNQEQELLSISLLSPPPHIPILFPLLLSHPSYTSLPLTIFLSISFPFLILPSSPYFLITVPILSHSSIFLLTPPSSVSLPPHPSLAFPPHPSHSPWTVKPK